MKVNYCVIGFLWTLTCVAGSARAGQIVPWDTFSDTQSNSICDIINSDDAEFVVLTDTQELVIVSALDRIIDGSQVDADGDVLINGEPAGFISFQEDADGFRTLWWTGINGEVVHVDSFTGEPSPSGAFPEDFENVSCDACEFWDDPTVCEEPPPPPVTVRICGNNVVVSMVGSLLGLTMLGLYSRRQL